MGRLPWNKTLDLNLVYRPEVLQGLALKLDVFNVLNAQPVLKYNEQYNTGSGTISTLYNSVQSFGAPRSMRLTAEFNHRF
jgi:hypothetical protein